MKNRLPTGPGSRGGTWHLPEVRNAYQREYRRLHGQNRPRPSAEPHPPLTDVLRELVREDVARTGFRDVARRLLVSHTTVSRWLSNHNPPEGDAINALVDAYGLRAIERKRAAMRRAA